MIKILHVVRAMDRGGAETMIMNFYRKINRNSFQFDFLVCVDKSCDYDEEIIELGGSIYRISEFKGVNYFSFKKACNNFFKEHHDYDIVHIHMGSCADIICKEAKKYNVKTIAHSHNIDFGLTLEGILLKILSFNTRNVADYFFACSLQAGKDRFGSKVIEGNKFSIINNGIDAERYRFSKTRYDKLRKEMNLTNKIVYGHVGRFIPIKNHDFLIDIFNDITARQPNAVLLLAGRGPTEDKIKEKVKKLNLEDKVRFLGVRSDIDDILNVCDCFVFPSKFEGLAIALVEAQATGVPSVISDVIPNEGRIIDEVYPLSIHDSKDKWVNKCLEITNTKQNRIDTIEQIKNAKFDINSSLEYLCDKYIEIVNTNNK